MGFCAGFLLAEGEIILAGNTKKATTRKRRTRKPNTQKTRMEELLTYLMTLKDKVIEEERMPWSKGFTRNPLMSILNRPYTGSFNIFMLMLKMMDGGYTDPRFVSIAFLIKFGKEKGLDWKGEEGVYIFQPKPYKYKVDSKDGAPKTDGDGEDESEEKSAVSYKPIRVFNVEQVRGMEKILKPLPDKTVSYGDSDRERVNTISELLHANFNKKPMVQHLDSVKAPAYYPSQHKIVLPGLDQYDSWQRYMQSFAHETAHASGGKSEIDRLYKGVDNLCVGERKEYAVEEMIAQFSTAVLLNWLGVEHDDRVSSDYIVGWFGAVEKNPQILEFALVGAKRCIEYVTEGVDISEFESVDKDAEQFEYLDMEVAD